MIKEQIKKDIGQILKKYCYESNIEEVRENVINDVSSYLNIAKENKKLFDFKVVCDESNNLAKDIETNTLHCRLALKFFPKDKKFTVVDCVLTFEPKN